jgi:ribosomal protein S18 acetylase RimI-like enzyme
MLPPLKNGLLIRPAEASDHAALSYICLKTGDAGQDASAREDDPELIGLVYVLPYQVFEPGLAFVVEGSSGICGYVVGALDTARFNARLASDWYPKLQQRVADPGADRLRWTGSDWLRHHILHPPLEFWPALAPFPSHAHIDLLPEIQGRGIGRQLLTLLEERLADAGSVGLHLGVAPQNQSAMHFYEALGYSRLSAIGLPPDGVYVGKRLAPRELVESN